VGEGGADWADIGGPFPVHVRGLILATLALVLANVLSVAVLQRTAARWSRPALMATLFAMALLAYMSDAACAAPGGAGPLPEAPSSHAYEIPPGPAP